ncbi:putative NRAMP family protein [Lupinus albus]|uniref:Putative NRAMP family protein n=1 Tax=Lupinus albus TaxID=3870 RepID=A0A6A4R702_LUPAL|nr:putative NRAMP family protein [Lupinus albus]
MNTETSSTTSNQVPSFFHRSLPSLVFTLLISIAYADPGKLISTVEGGALFGFDLMTFMLIFNLAAILCHYISAKIGIVIGKDLAQVFYLGMTMETELAGNRSNLTRI